MIWTWLRSCYKFILRFYVGGREHWVPARWYFTAPGAKVFPGPHGMEASPWLKNYEVNYDWGEVTPWPTDRDARYRRGLDRGLNPGYKGQCFLGQRQWFIDGQLPDDFFDLPEQNLFDCCKNMDAGGQIAGGLVLGGVPLPTGKMGIAVSGGLRLGGVPSPTGKQGIAVQGGIVLGGAPIPLYVPSEMVQGGLQLGGSPVPAGNQGIAVQGGLQLGGSPLASGSQGIATEGGLQLGGSPTGREGLTGVASGALVFNLSPIPHGNRGVKVQGGVVLGGNPLAFGQRGITVTGGLQLGGSPVPRGNRGIKVKGGLVLGGSPVPGRGVTFGCSLCPGGAPLNWGLGATGFTGGMSAANGNYTLAYQNSCIWNVTSGSTTWVLSGQSTGGGNFLWTLAVNCPGGNADYEIANMWSCLGSNTLPFFSGSNPGECPSSLTVSPA